MDIFEVDYKFKDKEAWLANPKEVPTIVVAENVAAAVDRAKDWEDDNLTLCKCNLVLSGNVAIQKALRGLVTTKSKEKAAEAAAPSEGDSNAVA